MKTQIIYYLLGCCLTSISCAPQSDRSGQLFRGGGQYELSPDEQARLATAAMKGSAEAATRLKFYHAAISENLKEYYRWSNVEKRNRLRLKRESGNAVP